MEGQKRQCYLFAHACHATVEVWKEQFVKALGKLKTLKYNSLGLQYKKSLSHDGVSSGTVSLTFWPSTLGVNLQGANYLDFTTFGLSHMVENIGILVSSA